MRFYKYYSTRLKNLTKSKAFFRSISLLLILLILSSSLCFMISCQDKTPDVPGQGETGDTDGQAEGTDNQTEDSGNQTEDSGEGNGSSTDASDILICNGEKASFRIVYPSGCEEYIKQTAQSIAAQLKQKINTDISVVADSSAEDSSIGEILVGNTNRTESVSAYKGLKYGDLKVSGKEKAIVIAALNKDVLEDAASRFLQKTFVYSGSLYSSKFVIQKKGVYDITDLKLGGNDISKYTIICQKDTELAFAKEIRDIIAKYNGSYLSIVDDKSKVKADALPFYIGSTVFPEDASKKSNTVYTLRTYDSGYSLWYADTAAGDIVKAQLEKGLSNSVSSAILNNILPGAQLTLTEEDMNLTVMSFNVLNGWNTSSIGTRDDATANIINQYLPDVMGFQEFDPYYRDAANPLPSLIANKYTEVNVTGGTANKDKSWNPIFYKTDRLTLKASGYEVYRNGTFHESYGYPGHGPSMFRTVSWAVFEDKESKQSFIFMNTHYDYSTDTALTEYNQRDEANQLVSLAQSLIEAYKTDTVFVTGDYNATATGAPCMIMKEAGFKDSWDIAQTKDDTMSAGELGKPISGKYTWAIDHIFYMADSIKVHSYKTELNYRDVSDHCPVIAALTVTK